MMTPRQVVSSRRRTSVTSPRSFTRNGTMNPRVTQLLVPIWLILTGAHAPSAGAPDAPYTRTHDPGGPRPSRPVLVARHGPADPAGGAPSRAFPRALGRREGPSRGPDRSAGGQDGSNGRLGSPGAPRLQQRTLHPAHARRRR